MSLNHGAKFAFMSENKGLGDLKSKSTAELKELLDRQNNILFNKLLIDKLKDKGQKVKKIRDEILQELNSRNTGTNIKQVLDSTAAEWRDTETKNKTKEENDLTEDETDALKILVENGQIPKHENKTHITKMIEKEKDPDFSFRPYSAAVAEKIKKVVPDAHTAKACPTLVKTVHLDESLNLLSQQMSALKFLGTRSRRVEECIEDRTTESVQEIEDYEETDEHETKVNAGISVNVNIPDC